MVKAVESGPFIRTHLRNWDELLNGQVYELIQGEDFQGAAKSIVVQAYNAARKRNKKARTRIDGNKVYIQGYDPNSQPVEPISTTESPKAKKSKPRKKK